LKRLNIEASRPSNQVDPFSRTPRVAEMMRQKDWSATHSADGILAAKPQDGRPLMLDSLRDVDVLGSDRTFFRNDAYLPTVGVKRDWVIGARSTRSGRRSGGHRPRIDHVMRTGERRGTTGCCCPRT
jgi:hypothetical protein